MICAVTFLFLAVLGRTFYVSVIWGEELQSKALDQWTRDLPITAVRGNITDINGEILASNKGTYAVYIRTRCVTKPELVAEKLSESFDVDKNELLKKIKAGSSSEITVAKGIDKSQVEAFSEYNLSGVYFSVDNIRVYPYSETLAATLGVTKSDGSGLQGIEAYYDKYLKGENGEILYESDLIGKDIANSDIHYMPAVNGLNVRMTVDKNIQLICENVLEKAMLEYSPKSASIIVLEPSSGRILAIAQNPTFDLNNPPKENVDYFTAISRNTLFTDSYEPGSTFKIVTSLANIEEYLNKNEKAISLDYIFNNNRIRTVDGRNIKCWSTHENGKHANQTLKEALNNSCNPCFVDMALSLGKETMYKYITKLNFGSSTMVDFPGEALGMVLPEKAVTNGDLARISFGQTIAVTPIQLAAAACSCVNGGIYYEPHLVEEIYDLNSSVSEIINPKQKTIVSSSEASRILASYLEGVVSEGSGKKAYIEGYRVGGKTGTAQKYNNGVIAQGKYVMSFMGFFPSNNPQYLALAICDEPINGTYGSTVAAPMVKEVFEGIIAYKNIKKFC